MSLSTGRPGIGALRIAALIALLAGAVGSAGLTLRAGQRNNSRLLIGMFLVWVLSPFIALAWASVLPKRWTALTRAMLYGLMPVLTLGSLAIYGDVALGPPRPKPAFVFLMVPLASWLAIALVIPIAALLSGKPSR